MPMAVIYIAAALLALGAAPLPYGYYTILRLIACAVFVIASYASFKSRSRILPYVFGGLALVFNPVVKVHLPKEVWAVIDLSAAVLLVATRKQVGAHEA